MARSYTILGTGALGGYYGARLHHGGCDVRFLLHSDFAHVRAHGLRVESPHGDFSIRTPQVFARVTELPPADVVAVCLKTTQNHLLPELLPPAVGPQTVVLMMQNGLGIEARAAAIVPGNRLLGGLAFLCSNKVGPGHIRHLDYGEVRLAEHRRDGTPAGVTPMVEAIAADFERAGIRVHREADLELARWKKLVWNVPFNGLCVVRRCTTDVLMSDPVERRHCEALMQEVCAAAAACGRPIDPAFVSIMMATTDRMASYSPSMKLDAERGQPLEHEAIHGAVLRAAQAAGVACPRIAALYAELVAVNRQILMKSSVLTVSS